MDPCTNFFISYETIDASEIVDIHKRLMKKYDIVQMPGFIGRTFIIIMQMLSFGRSLAIVRISINNQHCMVR